MKIFINVILNLFQDPLPADRSVYGQVRCRNKFGMTRKLEGGFTLVELLASVIVLVAIGSVVAGIITSSLRGANKTNTIENIRQNGNYALAQMSKDIQHAQSFDENSTGFNFNNIDDNKPKYLASCYLSSPLTIDNITVKSTDNIVTKYSCSGSTLTAEGIDPVGEVISLVDDAESISLTSCSVVCTQTKVTDVPIIKISFTLGPKDPSALPENNVQSSITFETSFTLRNYKK